MKEIFGWIENALLLSVILFAFLAIACNNKENNSLKSYSSVSLLITNLKTDESAICLEDDAEKIGKMLMGEKATMESGEDDFEFFQYTADSILSAGVYATDSSNVYITDYQKREVRQFKVNPQFKEVFFHAYEKGLPTKYFSIYIPNSVDLIIVRKKVYSEKGFLTPGKEDCMEVRKIRNFDVFLPKNCNNSYRIIDSLISIGVKIIYK